LDTWFSSAAWPFATLGWPAQTPDLAYFYPTSVLATGRDIIFLWVARMIMFGMEFMGDIPFTDVYINPTVLNIEGRRMSKSLGTGLDPLDYVEKGYGADALRFALALRCSQSQQDLRFGEKMLDDVRNFNNKIWNAARFVRTHLAGFDPSAGAGTPGLIDRWIRSRYARLIHTVTVTFESYDFDKAARALYDFIWSEYCDWYLELAKVDLYRPALDPKRRQAIQRTLWTVLEGTLRLLHPIMPHITEEIWQVLPHSGDSIVVAAWPDEDPAGIDEEAEMQMGTLVAVVRAVRSMRADLDLPAGARIAPILRADQSRRDLLQAHRDYVVALTRASEINIEGDRPQAAGAIGTVADGVGVALAVAEADRERARKRLEGELRSVRTAIERTSRRLGDESFVARAPEEVVEEERRRDRELRTRERVLGEYLKVLG
ncbi:MAG: class I tRNA ligase family protein, partial [bacterium]